MSDRPLDPRSLANYILAVRRHFGYETTNLEIQKIAFFCYAKYLSTFSEKLCEGYFEAWEHGPVHPLLYREFKQYGSAAIRAKAVETDIVTGETRPVPLPHDAKRRTHIAETVLQLRGLSASQLRAKSHVQGGPWYKVWNQARVNLASQVIIPDNVIREDFGRHMWTVRASRFVDEEVPLEDYPPEFNRGS